MPAASGIVQTAFVKEYPEPKSFVYEGKTITNTHRQSIKMGDKWYGIGDCNNGKAGEIYTKSGMITEGAEIEFMYDVAKSNGKEFYNIKKATVTVLKPGNANSYAGSAPSQGSAPKSSGGFNSNIIGMSVGAAMNQASNLHAKDKTLDFDAIEKTAIQMYKIAEGLKSRAEAGDIESAVVDKTPQTVSNPHASDNFDDDIPF